MGQPALFCCAFKIHEILSIYKSKGDNMFLVVEGARVYNLNIVKSIFIIEDGNNHNIIMSYANSEPVVIFTRRDADIVKKCFGNLLDDMRKEQKVIALRW